MPNYCYNSLTITGDRKLLDEIHKRWLYPDDPLKQRVAMATLRLLDWCVMYSKIVSCEYVKHGKMEIWEILAKSYEILTDIDILDLKGNDPADWKFEFKGEAHEYFMEIIKHLYKLINMTPKQLINHRLLRNRLYSEELDDHTLYRFDNILDSPDILSYRDALPVPKKFEERFSYYYWNLNNIGQKWGSPDGMHVQWEDNSMTCTYDTAWGPADIFVSKLSKQYPELLFELSFNETGMMFAGEFTYQNGKLVKQNVYEDSSYAGMQQFIGWDDEDILRDLFDSMEDISYIREDCKGYINDKTIDAFFKIKRPKIKKKKNKKKSKSDVRQIRIKHVI